MLRAPYCPHDGHARCGRCLAPQAGLAQVASAGLRYPLVRSQSRNLTLGVDFQHKKLRDDYRAADVRQNKSSNRVPFRAQFDLRDGLGGGVTYGALNWTVEWYNPQKGSFDDFVEQITTIVFDGTFVKE